MGAESVFAIFGAVCAVLISAGICADLVSYAHTMWGRYSARRWYRRGRRDERDGAADFFAGQEKPTWRW